jgi:hypothetical protein
LGIKNKIKDNGRVSAPEDSAAVSLAPRAVSHVNCPL